MALSYYLADSGSRLVERRNIFRVRAITQQPSRQVYPSVKMRQHKLLEPDSIV